MMCRETLFIPSATSELQKDHRNKKTGQKKGPMGFETARCLQHLVFISLLGFEPWCFQDMVFVTPFFTC